MFYVTTLEHEIVLEPLHFGPKLRATIVRLLKEEVEGLVSEYFAVGICTPHRVVVVENLSPLLSR
jgi:DNA-directed RNA polymerase subunit E'/Rpb7